MPHIDAKIGDTWVQWTYQGETTVGPERVLLDDDDDLTRGQPWADTGYTIAPFLDAASMERLRRGITEMVAAGLRALGVNVPQAFDLEQYHSVIGNDDRVHAELLRTMRACAPIAQFPLDPTVVERRISELLGTTVVVHRHREAPPCFCFRIVRPLSNDNNPPHRDVWLDRLRNAVNIYAPIAGSDARSSLPLLPGSHRWKESELERTTGGARVGENTYTVPSVVRTQRPFELERPDPRPGEVLLFSPYLIHGGARNLNADRTRVSLEMRFIRDTNPWATLELDAPR